MIRPCDACGGVYYDGEPCRFCERLENAYQRGQEAMRKRAAALVAALYDEFPGQHDYLKGGQLALDLAEQRIRALEVEP